GNVPERTRRQHTRRLPHGTARPATRRAPEPIRAGAGTLDAVGPAVALRGSGRAAAVVAALAHGGLSTMARRWCLLASLLLAVAGCSEPFKPVSERGSAAFEAALAVSGNQVAVAWYGNRNRNGNGNGNDDIYLRVLD